ncbi:MAG: hypothetical protein Q8M20_02915 [Rhodocyclaceae bacterium]|nr:hypothetical protein [Rhodocyclaceae bacterium]MDZ4213332.1 protein YgfX [Rhodocyclaceae bacterium]
MQLPVVIPVRSSRRWRALLWGAHAVAITSVLPLDLAWAVRLCLVVLIGFSLYRSLTRPQEITQLSLGAKGELTLATKVGAGGTALILPETAVLPGMVVLVLRFEGKRTPLVLMADALDPEDYRRLRVWLNWRAKRSEFNALV